MHKTGARCGDNKILYSAMRKYGIDNFIFEILYCSKERDHTLYEMEPYFIQLYEALGQKGYNANKGGGAVPKGMKDKTLSKETRAKISQSRKGQHAGQNNPNYGKTTPQNVKEKLSKSNKGKTKGEKNAMYGKKWITNGHENMRVSLEEYSSMNQAEWKFGRFITDETKRKLKISNKESWDSIERRNEWSKKLMGEGNPFYGKTHSMETIQQIKKTRGY
jgi:group I intron endonuclease